MTTTCWGPEGGAQWHGLGLVDSGFCSFCNSACSRFIDLTDPIPRRIMVANCCLPGYQMSISGFVIRILFLALPGILASTVYHALKGRARQKDWEDFREIALFSLSSYLILGVAVDLWNRFLNVGTLRWLQALFDEAVPLSYYEIAFASLIGVVLSLVATYFYTTGLLCKLGRRIHVTNRYGDSDVWDLFFDNPQLPWLFIRDYKTNLTYSGWVLNFSDGGKPRELLMKDVIVYRTIDAVELYRCDGLYLSREPYDLTMIVPPQCSEHLEISGPSKENLDERHNQSNRRKASRGK